MKYVAGVSEEIIEFYQNITFIQVMYTFLWREAVSM